MKKIVYLIDRYTSSDAAGAVVAVRDLYDALLNRYDITIICGVAEGLDRESRSVVVASPIKTFQFLVKNKIDIIHYFKATGRRYFSSLVSIMNKNDISITIITTICQKPSYQGLELSPCEIKNSAYIVFIDKSAYNDRYYQFISDDHKRIVYFGYTKKQQQLIEDIRSKTYPIYRDYIHFGRGSSLNKCHTEMISTYCMIDAPHKKFTFVGGHKLPERIRENVEKSSDVEWIPAIPYSDWLRLCANFDVFLYQLPEDAYSSIDGTLGDAMLLGIPPIVYGPEAIKERIHHGQNGFVANTIEEVVKYANILSCDTNLRNRLGEQARETTLAEFPFTKTVEEYSNMYEKAHNKYKPKSLPLTFYFFFYFRLFRVLPQFIKSRFHA